MKKYFTLACALCFFAVNAQNVGINTTSPSATLDVDGNVKIRTVDAAAVATTYDYLVVDPSTKEVQKVNGNFGRNMTIAKGKTTGSFSLLSLDLNGWQNINFNTPNISIDTGGNYTGATSSTASYYTVPSTGIYEIDYSLRFGRGVELSVLTDKSVGIIRQTATTTTLLDSKSFDGLSVAFVLTLSITSSSINSVYQLNAGDKIYFAASNGINVSLLGSSQANFVIKKISN